MYWTDLTSVNCTADLMHRRNMELHEQVGDLRRQLNTATRQRLDMPSTSSKEGYYNQEEREKMENEKLAKIVKIVLQVKESI